MISSAVIVPEPEELAPRSRSRSPSRKRRHPSPSNHESFKRPRLDTQSSKDANTDTYVPSTASPYRRKSSITGSGAAEERKRGQRLFGALLGTLSQSSTTTAQRRRADIEKKQLGKLQQRDENLEEEKRRKREKLDAIRRKEQKVWDEQSIRIRHRNMLAEAHFLKTKAEPILFYKPWELRLEEEEQIKQQIEDVEKTVEAEVQEHNAKKQIDQKAEEVQYPEASASKFEGAESQKQPEDEKDMMQDMEQPKVEFVGTDTTNAQQTVPENSTCERDTAKDENKPQVDRALQERENVKPEEKTNDDHGGEELVEGQEDDVIY